METKNKKFDISSLVFTILSILFIIATDFFGFTAIYHLFNPNEDNQLGSGLASAFMVLFFIIGLIPTLIFSVGGIALCIYPLKNHYHKGLNIFKLVINIVIILVCILILLSFVLKK